jgi:LysM repeat protein/GH24 family phage-related lysozyme (muramidase)
MTNTEYRVQSGDTLATIARRYGTTVDVLSRLNGLSDVNRIWAGQVLRIPRESQPKTPPPAQPSTYRVQAGDTLSQIARRNNVTVEALVLANSISDPNRIGLGQVLKIPKEGQSTPQKQTPSTQDSSTKTPSTKDSSTKTPSTKDTGTKLPTPSTQDPKKVAAQKGKETGSSGQGGKEEKKASTGIAKDVPQEVLRHLEEREGSLEKHQRVYDDGRGFLTAGMGHKLTKSELARYKENDIVPLAVLKDWAKADVKKAYDAAVAQAAMAGVRDQNFVNALTSVNFQLGTAWYTEHKKTWAYIKDHKWEQAAVEAADSSWNKQTPVRVKDFQAALRAMNGGPVQPVGGSSPGKTGQGPDLKDIARNVHDAMAGLGTDEQKVYSNLARLNHDPSLISQFKSLYKKLYQVDVVAELKSEFTNSYVYGNELNRALSYLEPRGKPADKGTQAPGGTGPVSANAKTLELLAERARKDLKKSLQGFCAKGVSIMLGDVGYKYEGTRPTVSHGIVKSQVYDYSTQTWISSDTQGHYTSNSKNIDKKHNRVEKRYVKSARAYESAKYFAHTLRMLGFADCTKLLAGNGKRETPPQESVKALQALPAGAIVVFGPSLSRSVLSETVDGNYHPVGGHGHAGHVGILVRDGKNLFVVADGAIEASGATDTVENCLSKYAWAIGFVPTTEPRKLTRKDLPSKSP